MSKLLGTIKFIGQLHRRGSPTFPVSLTFEMYSSSLVDGEPTVVLTIPDYRSREQEINWYTLPALRHHLDEGIVYNDIASVKYTVDSALLGIWLDSTLLGL